MASRLDRLFILLESGSSSSTRRTAAQQLGQVQHLHPHELPHLLNRVSKCLRSPSWETRIAGGLALEAIISQLPLWTPSNNSNSQDIGLNNEIRVKEGLEGEGNAINNTHCTELRDKETRVKEETNIKLGSGIKREGESYKKTQGDESREENGVGIKREDDERWSRRPFSDGGVESKFFTFDEFDIRSLLSSSDLLMSSETGSFLGDGDGKEGEREEKLAEEFEEFDPLKMVKFENMLLEQRRGRGENNGKNSNSRNVETEDESLSSREMNLAKRRARKQKSREMEALGESSTTKKQKTETEFLDYLSIPEGGEFNFYERGEREGRWPWGEWYSFLLEDLKSPSWEVRHGAGTGLRELVRIHGTHAGKYSHLSPQMNDVLHERWCEDLGLRLISVLALDRFGDFIGDQVVAPVRETVAQTLGTLLPLLSPSSTSSLVQILCQMLGEEAWEVRHGALLAFKYLFAVRKDLSPTLLPLSFPLLLRSLSDRVDDVVAVGGAALLPVSSGIVEILPHEVGNVLRACWDSLGSLDDLSAASNYIMSLLASLLAYPAARRSLRCLDVLLPRLLPFLHHTSSSVRSSTLSTLSQLSQLNPPVGPLSQIYSSDRPVGPSLTTNHAAGPSSTLSTSDGPVGPLSTSDVPSGPTPILDSPVGPSSTLDCSVGPLSTSDSPSGPSPILDSPVGPLSAGPLQLTLRHLFQRALVETSTDVLLSIPSVWSKVLEGAEMGALLQAACPLVGTWLYLGMIPPRVGIEPGFLVPNTSSSTGSVGKSLNEGESLEKDKIYMSGSGDGNPLKLAQTRLCLAEMLGELTHYVVQPLPPGVIGEEPLECYARVLLAHLNTRSALQRTFAALVLSAWGKKRRKSHTNNSLSNSLKDGQKTGNSSQNGGSIFSHPRLESRLLECLSESIYFDEVAYGYTKLQSECRDFISTLKHYNVQLESETTTIFPSLLPFDSIEKLCGESGESLVRVLGKKTKVLEMLEERRRGILGLLGTTRAEFNSLTTTTLGALGSGVVNLGILPSKLSPVVKPLMESIRKEENYLYQEEAGRSLCILIADVQDRTPCPVPKIIQNLVGFLCNGSGSSTNNFTSGPGIISLDKLNSPEIETKKSKTTKTDDEEEKRKIFIQERGATGALSQIVSFFKGELETKVPKLFQLTFDVLLNTNVDDMGECEIKRVADALQILETISPHFHPDIFPKIEGSVHSLLSLLTSRFPLIRHNSSRVLAAWASVLPHSLLSIIGLDLVPCLENGEVWEREGRIEGLWAVVNKCGLGLLPYIVLLVVPVLGRMSDKAESVRQLAALVFASLVRIMPLEGGVPDPPNLPPQLVIQKTQQREFLEQLLSPKTIPNYQITVPIKAELRSYQQAGVNWLGFLNKYKLHGILCDDMGLGKTLQSICILASDSYNIKNEWPSIVICPPTLTGHWVYEIEQFVESAYLNPLHYHGGPPERTKLRAKLKDHNLVVVSYDIVRNDIGFFSSVQWNYCILDEGHMIKNGKTKVSLAIKQLRAHHRLILSGTPIQNNVLELWSLFDFLMPGFLGSERQFSARFARPILLSRDPKRSSRDEESGALAMEALHRQSLPFLLRRLKEDVLQDLPPKITQDYYCELSPIQEELYEDFARTRAHQSLRDNFNTSSSSSDDSLKHSHIFQALQYLRKVCNHPKLVLSPVHPKYSTIMEKLGEQKSSLNDIRHSAKLPALKQLLLDCGIGSVDASGDGFQIVNQHRALIFCQLKTMLDILENDLLKAHMPTVTYLRLDGNVPAAQRHSLVTKFNNDPSIDLLLLTTQVGGLGLNLTGADTVIFVEHDWNPMRDLQAMDRAHRIGQKKVVNVYRLITRGTLEEKIMGLQKFKLMTANTIISQENSCIETMATDQLLDLFVLEENGGNKSSGGSRAKEEDIGSIVGVYKNVIENIPDLWDDKLYDEEYDLSSFIKNLGK